MLLESVDPYSYKLDDKEVMWEEGRLDYLRLNYSFETREYEYGVTAKAVPPQDHYIEIFFGIPGKNYKEVTNEGEVFRVMETIAQIVKEVGMNWGAYFKGFKFSPASDEYVDNPLETKRGKMFKRFVKKIFPSSSFRSKGDVVFIDMGH